MTFIIKYTPLILLAITILTAVPALAGTDPKVFEAIDAATITKEESESLLSTIGGWLWAAFCVVGPILQYAGTLKNPTSLSPYVILILMLSNIIRIFYFFASPFELSLLFQSFVMVFMMVLLLNQLCAVYKEQIDDKKMQKYTLLYSGLELDKIWTWTDGQSYQFFLTPIIAIFALGWMTFGENKSYGAFLGYLSLGVEGCLGFPQAYKFFKNGAAGESPVLFLTWLAGDVAKTAAFIGTGAQLPFVICGIVQTITDLIIIGQIIVDTYILKKQPNVSNVQITTQKDPHKIA